MGHTTYVRCYMLDFVDANFQEIVFGSEPQQDIVESWDGCCGVRTHGRSRRTTS